jgi:hypothetical protein
MSIMVCDDCERYVDTDFDPMYEVNGKCLCELCDEKVISAEEARNQAWRDEGNWIDLGGAA